MNEHSHEAVTRRIDPGTQRTLAARPLPPSGYQPPPGRLPPAAGPGAAPRRRRPRLALIAVLVVTVLLGTGVAAKNGLGGADGQTADHGVALAPQTDNAGQLPNAYGDGARNGADPQAGPGPGGTSGLAPAATLSDAQVAAIAAKVTPGLVDLNITLAYGGGEAAGTGMVLSASGLVLTSNHVVQSASEIRVTSVGTGKTYTATVLGYDRSHDIALLQLSGASALQTVSLGDSSTVAIGDGIVAIGNAGGDGGEPTSVGGTVTALSKTIVAAGPSGVEQLQDLIEVGANVQSGQSGGPTVSTSGEVIGVTTAASTGYSFEQAGGTGYAVPINRALAIVEQIQQGRSLGTVHVGPTAFLGVSIDSSADLVPYGRGSGSQTGSGARVAGALPGTPAEAAGMRGGDLITSLGGRTVGSAADLTTAIGRHKPGDTVNVEWTDRFGLAHSATVTLTTGPPA